MHTAHERLTTAIRIDIPPLQLGEEVVDLHFFSPTTFCTSASAFAEATA
jgi:hypothetical protein